MSCQLANKEEIKQAFAQVHSVWPHDPDPAVHLQKRLSSVQHQRATWFVVKESGQVVCSLGAYPFQLFGPDGDRPARALGAVFTPAEHRGKGHAPRLIRWVCDYYAAQGTQDFILYSDIDPAYYQKLGFQSLPSYEWSWELPASVPQVDLTVFPARPLDPSLAGFRYGIRRQTEEARWVQEKQHSSLRLSRCLASGKWLLSRQDHGTYTLLESNLDQTAARWPELVRLVESDARQAQCHRVKGWWVSPEAEPAPELRDRIRPRSEEILMWASLRGDEDPWRADISRHGFRAHLSEHI
ncbi:GNAT family N-acetyltransferase [Oligoflexus tunisiensis]|uniref:GNAT family N-acetyltransferase n=1 Tax=Oligoflexus tunisiensis TaxID=708132 RepID=UPI00114CEDFC|nr:GNAT family N-acetyltransferase [Oligoflexus tunisiensis]